MEFIRGNFTPPVGSKCSSSLNEPPRKGAARRALVLRIFDNPLPEVATTTLLNGQCYSLILRFFRAGHNTAGNGGFQLKFRCLLSLFVILLLCFGQARAATLSQARMELAAASVGNKILFAGGRYNATAYSNVVDIYDVNNDSWNIANLSQAREFLSAASTPSKMLFGGGAAGTSTYSKRVDIYDANTNTWSTANLTQARSALTATSTINQVFFAGGYFGVGLYSAVVDIYDSSTGNWTTANLSQARNRLVSASAGNKVLFGGGWNGTNSAVVDIYDLNTRNWTIANLSQPRYRLAATSAGSLVLFAGGWNGSSGNYSDVVDIYNVNTNGWTTATLSQARYDLTAASIGNKVLFAGGWNGNNSDVVDIYDINTGNWSTTSLRQGRSRLAAASAGNRVLFAGGWNNSLAYSNVVDIFDCSSGECIAVSSLATTTPPLPTASVAPTTVAPSPTSCVGPPPISSAQCVQGTWITMSTISMDSLLQVSSSTPLIINGDLDQRGNDIVTSISSLDVSTSSLVVNGTARLNGTLILNLPQLWNSSSSILTIPILQAGNISSKFDRVNITINGSTINMRYKCATQQSDGHTLVVLLRASCSKGTSVPEVAIIVPLVCVGVLIGTGILGWYLLRVRRLFPQLNWILRSSTRDTGYYRRM